MNLQDAIEFLSNMADSYEDESELWQNGSLGRDDREKSLEKSMACSKKADAIRTVLNALSR